MFWGLRLGLRVNVWGLRLGLRVIWVGVRLGSGFFWCAMATNVSQAVAIYCLILFYKVSVLGLGVNVSTTFC